MLYPNVEYIPEQREKYEELVDMQFTYSEQSILWQCMNDKNKPSFHKLLDPIVRQNLTSVIPENLYRGVSNTTLNQLEKLKVNDDLTLDRVTSFTYNYSIAKQFAGNYTYGTNTIIHIINAPFAFNYKEHMINILLAAPDSEFRERTSPFGTTERGDKIEMIDTEDEMMLPMGTTLRVVDIINDHVCIYVMEVVDLIVQDTEKQI